ncbi:MAG: hypothetical protein C4583_02070 [Anaerolineaceae bacterium]|nr:MAG: hypothetical protein C4583_02070 [Anaerolineaceae bacterium]
MKTGRKSFYQISVIIALVIAGLLAILLLWQYWVGQPVLISREEAIQHAIEACNSAYGLQPVEQPTEFETEITTYEKAFGGFTPIASKAQRPVYVVRMKKGKWLLVGGPPPAEDNPGPSYWDECTQIIDAQTGESLSTPIE